MTNDEKIEAGMFERLRAIRWKDGLRCPRCDHGGCTLHARGRRGRRKLRCPGCGRTFTDLTGTPFARSHLPLTTWARAARLMADGEPTCSDLAVKLGVRLATAWRVRKVLFRVLADPDLRRALIVTGAS